MAANPVDQGLDTGPVGQALALAGMVAGVLYFLVAFGLWDRHRWAYWLTLGIAAGHVVGSIVGVLVGGPTWAMAVVSSVVPALIGAWLLTPGARRAFRI